MLQLYGFAWDENGGAQDSFYSARRSVWKPPLLIFRWLKAPGNLRTVAGNESSAGYQNRQQGGGTDFEECFNFGNRYLAGR